MMASKLARPTREVRTPSKPLNGFHLCTAMTVASFLGYLWPIIKGTIKTLVNLCTCVTIHWQVFKDFTKSAFNSSYKCFKHIASTHRRPAARTQTYKCVEAGM